MHDDACMYVSIYKQVMEIIARTHVIIQVKLKILNKGVRQARHAGLMPCRFAAAPGVRQARHVGLLPCRLAAAPGLGRLAVAGLVPRLACRRPRVRQAPHAGLMPRSRRPLKFKFPVLVLKTWIFKPHKTRGNAVRLSFYVFSTFSQMQIEINTVPVLNNTFLNPVFF